MRLTPAYQRNFCQHSIKGRIVNYDLFTQQGSQMSNMSSRRNHYHHHHHHNHHHHNHHNHYHHHPHHHDHDHHPPEVQDKANESAVAATVGISRLHINHSLIVSCPSCHRKNITIIDHYHCNYENHQIHYN